MATCLGKGFLSGKPSVCFVNFYNCMCVSFPFGFEGGCWI